MSQSTKAGWIGSLTSRLLHRSANRSVHAAPRTRLSRDQAEFWAENGFLVLPAFFGRDRLDALNRELDALWHARRTDDRGLVLDAFIDTPNETRMRFRNAPDAARDLPYKLNDCYLVSDLVRETVLERELVDTLGELLDGAPIAFNTLTFERGSQQRFHFDTFYMPPTVEEKLVVTWIALEDADVQAGPLRYYPRSHRIPPYRFSDGRLNARVDEMAKFDEYIERELAERDLRWETFPARAGDVFIWSAQLYHGGAPIEDMTRTRRSLVTHYFRAADIDLSVYVGTIVDAENQRFFLQKAHQTPAD
jgi:phytanoyl-CoA hydroxylase